MAKKEIVYTGGRGLYTEEDFAKKRKTYRILGFAMLGVVALQVILCIQKWISLGPVITIVGLLIIPFVIMFFARRVINQECKEMALNDAMFRVFSEEFEVESVEYTPNVTSGDYIEAGASDILESDLEYEIVNKGLTKNKLSVILPRLRVVGSYKNVPFIYNQYVKMDSVEKKHLTRANDVNISFSAPMDFLSVKTIKDFEGSVDIQTKNGGIVGKPLYYSDIQVEDIEFNNLFYVTTTSDLGGFRLLTPEHILRFKQIHGLLSKNNSRPYIHFEFKDGHFYTHYFSPRAITIGCKHKKKIPNILNYQKECQPVISGIKWYIDALNLEKENYTMG